ncbi:MAG: hypothetical protein ACC651_09235 [Candidatus Scalindua sp.]
MMFGRNTGDSSTISEYFEKKSKLLQKKKSIFLSKVDQVLHGKHEHYFSKRDVQADGKIARCKICGILLSEFKVQQKVRDSSPLLKSSAKQPI